MIREPCASALRALPVDVCDPPVSAAPPFFSLRWALSSIKTAAALATVVNFECRAAARRGLFISTQAALGSPRHEATKGLRFKGAPRSLLGEPPSTYRPEEVLPPSRETLSPGHFDKLSRLALQLVLRPDCKQLEGRQSQMLAPDVGRSRFAGL